MRTTIWLTTQQHKDMLELILSIGCPPEEEGYEDWVHGFTFESSGSQLEEDD